MPTAYETTAPRRAATAYDTIAPERGLIAYSNETHETNPANVTSDANQTNETLELVATEANPLERLDLNVANRQLEPMRATEVIRWAAENYGEAAYALTSFGAESALLPYLIKKAGVRMQFITIDTGFWFPETHDFKKRLTDKYNLDLHPYGPAAKDIKAIKHAAAKGSKLWEEDPSEYHEITKSEPLRYAIGELGVKALLSGVRAGQTATRAALRHLERGSAGELRVHPLLNLTEYEAARYFQRGRRPNIRGLPRHSLYNQGYGSIGDWTTTVPGAGREGRKLRNQECGLHVTADGKLVRAAA